MPRTFLTRATAFSAAHRYWRSDWPPERNRAVFGDQANRHGHNYRLEVTVTGEPDPETGFLVELEALDRALAEVVGRLDNRDLNEAVEEVREGAMLPSTEALARWIWSRLEDRIPGPAELTRVRLLESDRLGAEVSR